MSAARSPRTLDDLVDLAAELARGWVEIEEPIPYLIGDDDDGRLHCCALALDMRSYPALQDQLYALTASERLVSAVYVAEVWAAHALAPETARGVVDGSIELRDQPGRREEVMLLAQTIEGERRDVVMEIERGGRQRRKRYGAPHPLDAGRRYPFKLFAFRVARR